MSTTVTQPGPQHPYGRSERCHLQHVHLFASDLACSIAYYQRWFDAELVWDGAHAGTRNVFLRIGKGALHFYDQPPRELARNAIHHIGIQVVGLQQQYERMLAGGVTLPNAIRWTDHAGDGGYFMVQAPDNVLIEVFEPSTEYEQNVLEFFGCA